MLYPPPIDDLSRLRYFFGSSIKKGFFYLNEIFRTCAYLDKCILNFKCNICVSGGNCCTVLPLFHGPQEMSWSS